jgi:Holliday junction resolvase RusA-like endonuclease
VAATDIRIEIRLAPFGKARPRANIRWTGTIGGHRVVRATPFAGAKPFAHIHSSTRSQAWEQAFRERARAQCPRSKIAEATRVDILAVSPRPRRLSRRADPAGLIWAPLSRFDRDNIEKAVLDALSEFWVRDAVVVAGDTLHAFAEKAGAARTVVRIQSLEHVEVEETARALGLLGGAHAAPSELADLRALGALARELAARLRCPVLDVDGPPDDVDDLYLVLHQLERELERHPVPHEKE